MAASDLLLFATKATTVVMIMRRTRTRQDNRNSMTPPQRPPLLFAALPEAFGGNEASRRWARRGGRTASCRLRQKKAAGAGCGLSPLSRPRACPAPSAATSRTSARLLSAQNRSVSALGARRIPTKAEPSLHWPLRRRWGLPDSSLEAYSEATKTKDKKQ